MCILFLIIYPSGQLCRRFEYALVLACAAFAFAHHRKDAEGRLSLLALLFTAGADLFLVALREE